MVYVGQVVGSEMVPLGPPFFVFAPFDGEPHRFDTILVIHFVYRFRQFEALVTLFHGVEQYWLHATRNDPRKYDARLFEKGR